MLQELLGLLSMAKYCPKYDSFPKISCISEAIAGRVTISITSAISLKDVENVQRLEFFAGVQVLGPNMAILKIGLYRGSRCP